MTARLDTNALDTLINNAEERTDRAVAAMATAVEANAKPRTRLKTGALRNGINAEKQSSMLYRVQDSVLYGIHQELGTRFMSPQPFMIPAVEFVAPKVPEFFKGVFEV